MIMLEDLKILAAGYTRGIKPSEPVQEKLRVNLLSISISISISIYYLNLTPINKSKI